MKSLTHRQERFCHAFVHWANGAEAAREAGYTVRSARKQASVMLQTVRIRARIHEIQTQLAEDGRGDTHVAMDVDAEAVKALFLKRLSLLP